MINYERNTLLGYTRKTKQKNKIKDLHLYLLSKSSRSEHLSNKVDVPISNINPRSIKLHDIFMLQCLKQMNFTIQPLKIFRTLHKVIKLHLIPCYFNPFILIKSLISASKINPKMIKKNET